jgi:subtilisin family serine protease
MAIRGAHLTILAAIAVSAHVASGTPPAYRDGEVLVRFKPGTSAGAKTRAHAKVKGQVKRRFRQRELELVELPATLSVEAACERYRNDPGVLYAEPNYRLTASTLPNDPRFPEQWALHNTGTRPDSVADADIDAVEAWNVTTGSSDVVVSVIDTGVQYTHPALAGNMFRNEADCDHDGVDDDANGYADDCYGIDTYNDDSDPLDDESHGTHVSGIIGAVGNDGIGIAGVNWSTRILSCKFLNSNGEGVTSDAVQCFDYVAMMRTRG